MGFESDKKSAKEKYAILENEKDELKLVKAELENENTCF